MLMWYVSAKEEDHSEIAWLITPWRSPVQVSPELSTKVGVMVSAAFSDGKRPTKAQTIKQESVFIFVGYPSVYCGGNIEGVVKACQPGNIPINFRRSV